MIGVMLKIIKDNRKESDERITQNSEEYEDRAFYQSGHFKNKEF